MEGMCSNTDPYHLSFLNFYIETESHYVVYEGPNSFCILEKPWTFGPPASVSWLAEIIDLCHQVWQTIFSIENIREKNKKVIALRKTFIKQNTKMRNTNSIQLHLFILLFICLFLRQLLYSLG